jgi:Uma2 family endonuclease
MAALPQFGAEWTYESYLAFERQNDARHEYYQGLVYAMSGGTREHSLIIGNLFRLLSVHVLGGPCEAHMGELLVASRPHDAAFYPDVSVVCGDVELEWDRGDVLLNPTLIIEVLSESTERKDLHVKLPIYQAMPSVQDILYVRQERIHITHWQRDGEDWPTVFYRERTDNITLTSVGYTLKVVDIYDRIVFP